MKWKCCHTDLYFENALYLPAKKTIHQSINPSIIHSQNKMYQGQMRTKDAQCDGQINRASEATDRQC